MKSSSKRILIIKPSSLGDVVHTLPAVACIRKAYPKAEITWLINPEWAPVLRGNKSIDHVHIFPRGQLSGFDMPGSLLPWLRKTRTLQPDAALDFQGLLRSALIGRISKARDVYGMSDAREGARLFYDHVVKVNRREHAVERYLKLAKSFGAEIERPLNFSLPTGDPMPRFDESIPYVLLHPFARGRRKSLPDSAVESFCHAFAPVRVVLAGRTERTFSVPENCISLLNQTSILQLIWLIRAARFTVSVDSGPMHIAAAISDRLVSIHTWSDPRKIGPYNPNAWVWKNRELVQIRDLQPLEKQRRKRSFTDENVEQIATLVRPFLQ
ncbi:MAG: glycosyltransferase family 9 protein [Verrucomicrobiota bacterium]